MSNGGVEGDRLLEEEEEETMLRNMLADHGEQN